MTLLEHIRAAMPEHTTEIRMTRRTRMHLVAERGSLLHFALVDSHAYRFADRPVIPDEEIAPLTVVFVTNGRNYRFGWTI